MPMTPMTPAMQLSTNISRSNTTLIDFFSQLTEIYVLRGFVFCGVVVFVFVDSVMVMEIGTHGIL
jgi:hypothetical protein